MTGGSVIADLYTREYMIDETRSKTKQLGDRSDQDDKGDKINLPILISVLSPNFLITGRLLLRSTFRCILRGAERSARK